jgi:uncharacterized protein YjbI with pentapeptide repeats
MTIDQSDYVGSTWLEQGLLNFSELFQHPAFRLDLRESWFRSEQLAQRHDGIFWQADLSSADLGGAGDYAKGSGDPIMVVLMEGALRWADLSGANLEGADLQEARGWTVEQLREALSLEGATMPNGQKYEDWLKDKESHREDE